ncbi:MAG: hypothetical protein WCD44_01475, partial [Candidatus Babeliales bacterium]
IPTDERVVTFISPRSQSTNAARELVGWEHQVNLFKTEGIYGSFSVTPEITKSFRPERIAQCLFGDDSVECKSRLTISGSQTADRVPKRDWLADYFGLPTDFKSTVHFRPRVNNFLIDFNFFLGGSRQVYGLYFRIHAPLVYANWNLNMSEHILLSEEGSNNYPPGYFNDTGIERENLLNNFSEFISGEKAPEASNLTFQKLRYAKMSHCAQSLTNLSDIQTAIGFNPWQAEWYHVGFNVRFAIPTGNRPQAEFLFEPIVGNGHHWELGVGLSTHICVWQKEETAEELCLYLDANFMHLFKTDQRRSFDLKEKPNSRYMLAQKLGTPIINNLTGQQNNAQAPANNLTGQQNNAQAPADAQYQEEVTSLANLTTFDINASVTIQADLAFLFSYTKDVFTFSFGYGVWKQSCEDITIKNINKFVENRWSLKGDAHTFGFIGEEGDLPLNTSVALSATENKATINTGKNFSTKGSNQEMQIQAAQKNPHIDNKAPAFAGSNQRLVASLDNLSQENQINTSIQSQFITRDDIDVNSTRTRGTAQKAFSHINRTWQGSHFTYYVGFGAEVDFGRHPGPTPEVFEDECINCALSCWGIWLKGGFSF